jgi:predicted RNase H-like nuclease (RuvC/YqgF family)
MSSESATSPETSDRPSLIRITSQQANRILNLEEENQGLKNLVQTLKDEIRRLKGEKGPAGPQTVSSGPAPRG